MSHSFIGTIFEQFARHGANKFYIKLLSNNDNMKQQIYLGGSFEVIRILPFSDIRTEAGLKRPTFKASLDFSWMDDEGNMAPAPNAQLILYPKYPEVRLSGFARGCANSPSDRLQPLTREERERLLNVPRVMLLGVTPAGKVYGHVSNHGDALANEAARLVETGTLPVAAAVFYEWFPAGQQDNQLEVLLEHLRGVYQAGWIESFRLDKDGNRVRYKAQNGAGYTLEGMLGITPNGVSEPDLLGWELKAHSRSGRVTLMTPEPTLGLYAEDYVQFMQKYGDAKPSGRIDFTGVHYCGKITPKTGLTLALQGFEPSNEKITDSNGGLLLHDDNGDLAAGWALTDLIAHWGRKHANTAFVSYEKNAEGPLPHYRYGPLVTTAQGAPFQRYLNALHSRVIVYDPGCKIEPEASSRTGWKPKKRNQLRIGWKDLDSIYDTIVETDLSL